MTSKQIYQTIRRVPQILHKRAYDQRSANAVWEAAMTAIAVLGGITPRQLLQVFPVTKSYDGDRWQCKDYFFTMQALEAHGLDTLRGDHVLDVLWDYMNPHVIDFMMWAMRAMSDVRQAAGGQDPLVEWMESQGAATYSSGTDSQGREVVVNNQTGEVSLVSKPKPRWYRKLKGGMA